MKSASKQKYQEHGTGHTFLRAKPLQKKSRAHNGDHLLYQENLQIHKLAMSRQLILCGMSYHMAYKRYI